MTRADDDASERSAPRFLPPYWDADAPAPRFKMGTRVRVLAGWPPGHVRTPWYIRGRIGVVERVLGQFGNPEELAYGREGAPKLPLYRVRFALADIWGEHAVTAGDLARADTIDVEVYESWLEPFFDYASDPETQKKKVERDIAAAR